MTNDEIAAARFLALEVYPGRGRKTNYDTKTVADTILALCDEVERLQKRPQLSQQQVEMLDRLTPIGPGACIADWKDGRAMTTNEPRKPISLNWTDEEIRQKVLVNAQIENPNLTYEDVWGPKVTDPKPGTCRQNDDSSTRSEDMSTASTDRPVTEAELVEWEQHVRTQDPLYGRPQILRLIAALREARDAIDGRDEVIASVKARLAEIRAALEEWEGDVKSSFLTVAAIKRLIGRGNR